MKITLTVLALSLWVFSAAAQSNAAPKDTCKLITDGLYSLEYTELNYRHSRNFVIRISNGRFAQKFSIGDTVYGNIKWSPNCHFMLDGDNENKAGIREVFRLFKNKNDTILFVKYYTNNLHIVADEGRLVKLNKL